MADKNIKFKLTLENGQFKASLTDSTGQVQKFENSVNKASSTSKRGFRGIVDSIKNTQIAGINLATIIKTVVIGAFVKLGAFALKTASDFELNQVAFETMLKSADKAKALLTDITKFTAKTPFQLNDVVKGSKRLLAFGVAGNEVINTMRKLGDAASGNAQTLDTLTLAYGKIRARGKTSMEELNMILEAGVPILDQLSENFGVTQGQLFKMVEQGRVSFDAVNQALTNLTTGSGQFAGMMEKQSQTLIGLWSTFKDTLMLAALEIGQELLPAFKKLITFLSESKTLLPGIIAIFKGMGKVILVIVETVILLGEGIEWLGEKIRAMSNKFEKFARTKGLERWKKSLAEGQKELKNFNGAVAEREKLERAVEFRLKRVSELQNQYNNFLGKGKEESGKLTEGLKSLKATLNGINGKTFKAKVEMEKADAVDPEQTASSYMSAIQSTLGQLSSIYDEYYSQQATKVDMWLEKTMNANQRWYDHEKALIDQSLMNDEEKKAAQYALDEEFKNKNELAEQNAEKKKRKLQREQAKRMKGIKIAEIIVNTAAAIMQGFAQLGPIGGAVMAAVTAAMGVAQIAIVANAPLPALAVGTTNVPTDTLAQLHAGEAVIPRTFMDGVRAGDLTIGEGKGGGDIYINVEGSVLTENELINIIDKAQNDRAQSLGASNYYSDNPY